MNPSSTARADAQIAAAHPFRRHLRTVADLDTTRPLLPWTPADGPMPTLFLGHGAPATFENSSWMSELHGWTRNLPKPTAILVVSAHWESAPLAVSSSTGPELVYDFGGFAPMYFRMRYDTPVADDLAGLVGSLLPGPLYQHTSRGLDHGAWVPLKVMYPNADIPVLQMSIPTYDATELMALGRRLRPLREQGVLVVGSGFLTHGVRFLTPENFQNKKVPGWSADFDAWAADALARADIDELAAFRDHAPGMPYAHPTVEHFAPIFIALGAATDPTAPMTTAITGFNFGLSKRSFQMN
jgi:4,5-DOPA dioxygenase extradiol